MSTFTLAQSYVSVNCGPSDSGGGCGLAFAMSKAFYEQTHRTGETWYCPKGHARVWGGDTTEKQLADAQSRETALQDQLRAAIRAGDEARQETLRIRQRIANGVCPCCTRSFGDLRRHMSTQHPEFAVPGDWKHQAAPFRCSCGREYESFKGLRTHQGHQRDEDWDKPGTSRYWSHLTVV